LVDDEDPKPSPSVGEPPAEREVESGIGELGGELELEQTGDVFDPPAVDPDVAGGLELEGSLAGDTAGEDASDFGGALDLESEMDFLGGGPADSDLGDGLDLEEPMSEFSPDDPPAWMEQDGPDPSGDESVMDFSASSTEGEAPEGVAPARERREPRSRPSPPRPIKRRSGPGPFVALLVVAVLGAGGYYGWQTFAAREAGPPPRPAVVIPQIPAELVPQMQELAAVALRETFDEIDAQTAGQGEGGPSEPREEWLAGVYLANASRFSDVELFWANISRFSEMMRDTETTVFHEKYLGQAESAELESPVVVQLTERADSGFMATREERLQQYALLSTLADAALELHDFLVENESSIAYTPATGLSGNPVEEAVPNSQELSDQMWRMVEDLTNAQDALLGTLDRVNRELLLGTIRERIEQIGIS
jgi:hypothetical protein